MLIFLQILLWLIVAMVFHTYVGFPLILKVLSRGKDLHFAENDNKPDVTIIMSLFNEESVIAQKLDSIINSNYPIDKISVLIGSDNSTDRTNEIVSEYASKYECIHFFPFCERQGKSNVINSLIDKADSDIIILSDANVLFEKNTINELTRPFQNKEIGLVDSNMVNTGLKSNGISIQEKSYISREVLIKHAESVIWGTMMGPFGGCFAMRKELYSPVPKTFLVDDFYISMKVLEKGYKAINMIDAVVYEDVSNNLSDEFRRKIRIATGDFQNLKEFRNVIFSKNFGLSFSYISHKILRWITPVLLILYYLSNLALAFFSKFYLILFILFNLLLLLIPVDYLLKKINYNNIILRFVTHFFSMNLALLIGMFKSIKGVKTNVWKPTKRNQ